MFGMLLFLPFTIGAEHPQSIYEGLCVNTDYTIEFSQNTAGSLSYMHKEGGADIVNQSGHVVGVNSTLTKLVWSNQKWFNNVSCSDGKPIWQLQVYHPEDGTTTMLGNITRRYWYGIVDAGNKFYNTDFLPYNVTAGDHIYMYTGSAVLGCPSPPSVNTSAVVDVVVWVETETRCYP